jgi:hypothetical protein
MLVTNLNVTCGCDLTRLEGRFRMIKIFHTKLGTSAPLPHSVVAKEFCSMLHECRVVATFFFVAVLGGVVIRTDHTLELDRRAHLAL